MSYGSVDGAEFMAQVAHTEDSLEIQRLQRIQNTNTTGDCEDCGEPIPAARLAAIPNARFCIQCQSSHERKGGIKFTFSNPFVP